MATTQDHDQCIKAQAERVVAAYRDLRAASHNTDFASDEFPVGRLAELFQQVKQLDVWLEAPAAEPVVSVRRAAEEVIKLYREPGWDALAGESDGGYKPLLDLEEALGQLDRAIKASNAALIDGEDIERELNNVREIISEVDHLATDGEESSDPAASLAVIKRLAREAHSTMYGKLWDRITDLLEQTIYGPRYGELWGVIEDFSADELAALRNHAAAIRARRS
jgi:hypothetical protein